MELRKATIEQIPALTEISSTDLRADAESPARTEPMFSDFDNREWYGRMQAHGDLYALMDRGRPVGGALAFYRDKRLYIERVFAENEGQKRDILCALEKLFPDAARIELDAPEDNTRLLSLLMDCGFTPVRGNGDWVSCLKIPGGQLPASEFLDLKRFDGAMGRVTAGNGEVFEGKCSYSPEGFNDAELGIPEDGLQLDDLLIARSDIRCVETMNV